MYRLTSLEVHLGHPLPIPSCPVPAPPPPASPGTARKVLEQLLHEQMCAGSMTVAFSGGRDSSLLLAVATHVARRHGFPDPVPITERWPGTPSLDESKWQALVVRHLGLADWHVLATEVSESELLSASSRKSLRAWGVIYPVAWHSSSALWRAAKGTQLVDGEAGDETLGSRRATVLHHLRLIRSRPRDLLSQLWMDLAPRWLPAAWRGSESSPRSWWTNQAREASRAATMGVERADPFRFDRSLVRSIGVRGAKLGLESLDEGARLHAVDQSHPLADARFKLALAAEGGARGWSSRTELMAHLCGDLLPSEIVSRSGKVEFGASFWGPETRAFAARWDGISGIDTHWVVPARLREEWLSDSPHPSTALALHSAWLAQEGELR